MQSDVRCTFEAKGMHQGLRPMLCEVQVSLMIVMETDRGEVQVLTDRYPSPANNASCKLELS